MRACDHDTILTNGFSRLVRFRGPAEPGKSLPLLLVPSLINRWYVLDLHERGSLAKAFVDAGVDTYLLDWGIAEDEDRYFGWDDAVARLNRMVRAVRRFAGTDEIGMLGYCVGGTLSAIHTALEPDTVHAFANLAGPIDFSSGGMLRDLVDPRWFDPSASEHYVGARRVDLSKISCPTATIVAERDDICPPEAALALDELSSAREKKVIRIPGGHVGAVVGSKARKHLYPEISRWFVDKLGAKTTRARPETPTEEPKRASEVASPAP